MKLGSLKEGGRDGTLIVVSRDLSRAVKATGIASTLQQALEDWSNAAPRLAGVYEALQASPARHSVTIPCGSTSNTSRASPPPAGVTTRYCPPSTYLCGRDSASGNAATTSAADMPTDSAPGAARSAVATSTRTNRPPSNMKASG